MIKVKKQLSYEHVNAARKYAHDIVAGRIPAAQITKLSCQRFLNDLKDKESEWRFNRDRAERACRFLEMLPHVKGKWAGSLLKLEPWQMFIVCNLFGWVSKKTRYRRFRRAFILVSRKNGKTTFAAGIGLLMLTEEAEPGAEIYCGATSEDQANEVFRPAKAMSERAEGFREAYGVETMKSSIFRESGLSFFKKLIGKPGEGQSPYLAITDEYHEHPTSEQVDSMYTGMGARQQPLQLIITTAGVDISGPCKELDDYTRKVLDGTLVDETLFAIHYTIDEGDDWEDWAVWRKANPNLGVSVSEDFLQAKLAEAKQRVSQQNITRTKHLNQWVSAGSAWMNMVIFRKGLDENLRLEDFRGEPCYVGIDLASKIDITARVLLFKRGEHYYYFGRYYLPSDTVALPENQHYQRWTQEGWITETIGARTDFRLLEEDLKADFEHYPIAELAFDPREASYLIQNIMEWAPFDCIEVVQSPVYISEPMKELEAIIYDEKFHWNGDPVFEWMMSNVINRQAKTGAMRWHFPGKERDQNKIDGVTALIMALSRAMVHDEESAYDGLTAEEIRERMLF